MASKKKLVSGVQPTGRLHIGNYFGAIKQWIDLTADDSYESYFSIVDFHALTTVHNRDTLRENVNNLVLDYLALGLDPARVAIFIQSDVPELTELTWIFNCLITNSFLARSHAYKDAVANGKDESVGLFTYPVLMASDILLPGADIVPVGQDQKQHIEYARDIALKFNNAYGEFFKLPEPYILEESAVIPGTDGRKMSKSYGNTISIFASPEETNKAIMGIVTDSKAPEDPKDIEGDTLYALHTLVTPPDQLAEIKAGYERGGLGYGDIKKSLVENMNTYLAPFREKRSELEKNPDYVQKVLDEGRDTIRKIAVEQMNKIHDLVGLGFKK